MLPTIHFSVNGSSFSVEPASYTDLIISLYSSAGIELSSRFAYEITIFKDGRPPVSFLPESHFVIAFPTNEPHQPYLSFNDIYFYPLERNTSENPYVLVLSLFSKLLYFSKFNQFMFSFRF